MNAGSPERYAVPAPNKRPNLTYNKVSSVVIKNDRILNFMHFRHTVLVVMCIILFYLIRVNGLKHHRKMGLWRAFLVFLIRSEFKYILLYWQCTMYIDFIFQCQKINGPSRPWWKLDLQLPMQSVPITTDGVSSNLEQGEMYNIMW